MAVVAYDNFKGNTARNVKDPVNLQDAATKAYVDSAISAIPANPVKATKAEAATGTNDTKFLTPLSAAELYKLPEGTLWNGKILPSIVSTNHLLLELKTWAGNDPSSTDPAYVKINGTLRTITAATSSTAIDGYNYLNMGSAELAAKEVDLFAYLFWNTVDNKVSLAFSRYPAGTMYSDFGGNYTGEKHMRMSDSTPNATDICVNIGRFAATLSAGAGYTWTVPTFTASNLIQRPIFETRALSFTPVYTSGGGTPTTVTPVATYKIIGKSVRLNIKATITNKGTATGAIINTLPLNFANDRMPLSAWEGAVVGYVCQSAGVSGDLTKISTSKYDFTTMWTTNYVIFVAGTYEI